MAAGNRPDGLKLLLKSGYKLIWFSSQEELRAEDELLRVAKDREGQTAREWYVWRETTGFLGEDGKKAVADSRNAGDSEGKDLVQALAWVNDRESNRCKPALYVFKDAHPFLGSSGPVRMLKDAVQGMDRVQSRSAIVLLSGHLEIPKELEKDLFLYDFPLPTKDELVAAFSRVVDAYRSQVKTALTDENHKTEQDGIAELANAAKGLTVKEASLALGKAIIAKATQGKALGLDDVQQIVEDKKQIVRKTGILTFETPGPREDVGGLEQLWKWLEDRGDVFSEEARRFGLVPPKGVLLTGVPGCGKTLCARAMASFWDKPILRMDMGAIYGKYVGESEANLRSALRTAEAMSPCILLMDEIEKALAGGGGDGGVGTRVFGSLLSWMNDKQAPVFVAATANQLEALPAELLRKGRFDEIFFVDFPHIGERKQILRIHVKKAIQRKSPTWEPQRVDDFLAQFGLDTVFDKIRQRKDGQQENVRGTIAQISFEYTGAEIEEAVKTAMIHAYTDGKRDMTAEDVADALVQTIPSIDAMRERITKIRRQAAENAIAASRASLDLVQMEKPEITPVSSEEIAAAAQHVSVQRGGLVPGVPTLDMGRPGEH